MTTNTLASPSPTSVLYWDKLKNLSNDVKLELISMLSFSLVHPREDWTESFAGKWKDDRTTEEIIDDIHAARNTMMREVVL